MAATNRDLHDEMKADYRPIHTWTQSRHQARRRSGNTRNQAEGNDGASRCFACGRVFWCQRQLHPAPTGCVAMFVPDDDFP
jgi:hypothetical protein